MGLDPHSGGDSLPKSMHVSVRDKILDRFRQLGLSDNYRIEVKFRGAFCYVDAYEPSTQMPTHLFRLRYLSSKKKWSAAFFAYSSEKYEPCFFPSGEQLGHAEDAVELAKAYL